MVRVLLGRDFIGLNCHFLLLTLLPMGTGKVKRIRCSRVNKRPLLKYVRPIAVVAGQETTLTVCGYNLAPQTK